MPGKPVIGAGVLRYPQVMSPNFDLASPAASPEPSWAILQSGLAYFFGLVLSGGTVTGVGYVINANGAFFYTTSAAQANTLAISIVPGNIGVNDPAGNKALPGTTNYWVTTSPFQAMNIVGTTMEVWTATDGTSMAGGWTPTPTSLSLQSATVAIESGGGIGLTPASGDLIALDGPVTVSGTITATAGTAVFPTLISTDTAHNASSLYANGWAALTTGTTDLVYELQSDGMVQVSGRLVNSTAGGISGSSFITGALPAAYRPARDEPVWAYAHGASPFPEVSGFCLMRATGLEFFGTFSTADTLEVGGRYPLGF